MKTNYKVTPETGEFVETLHSICKAQDQFIKALTLLYGESDGNRIYEGSAGLWDAITAKVVEYMTISITSNFGAVRSPGEPVEI